MAPAATVVVPGTVPVVFVLAAAVNTRSLLPGGAEFATVNVNARKAVSTPGPLALGACLAGIGLP